MEHVTLHLGVRRALWDGLHDNIWLQSWQPRENLEKGLSRESKWTFSVDRLNAVSHKTEGQGAGLQLETPGAGWDTGKDNGAKP